MKERRNSSRLTHCDIMGKSNQEKWHGGEIMREKRSVSVASVITLPSLLRTNECILHYQREHSDYSLSS